MTFDHESSLGWAWRFPGGGPNVQQPVLVKNTERYRSLEPKDDNAFLLYGNEHGLQVTSTE